ncbi:transcription factor HHO5 [Cajanus cajan]|uniref:transcription factor HHO5 n=1 Tax=Cajanus cajan TaxID=3821 RepID=UPI00098D893F|nr:transcription factor HHO5 [Cajanus cajan]
MEPNLDLSLAFVPISEILSEVSQGKDGSQKNEDFVQRLEDEKRKIEAFKRELPLCMMIVNDVISRLKGEIKGVRMQDKPVVEELVPLMETNSEENGSLIARKEKSSDTKKWMNLFPLCNAETNPRNKEGDRCVPKNPIQPQKETDESGGTSSLAFNGNKCVSKTVMRDDKVPSLGLTTPMFELNHRKTESGCGHSSSLITSPVKSKGQLQSLQNTKKQRRSWSPELHRKFVDALQQLGRPQVATPKQIKELMQVVGLTNDEVKSHLQKYRLHFKRPQVCSNGQGNNRNSGLGMMAEDKSKGNLSQSGSPQGPLFLGGSGKGLSSSGRNSTETEEDEQSDCRNWKGGLHPTRS